MKKWCITFWGLEICGDEYTYKPSEDSLLLFTHMSDIVSECNVVYDVGSGSGIITLGSAKQGVYSIGIELIYDAVLMSLDNSFRNGLDGYVDYVNGDCLNSLRLDIDGLIIVSNPPYVPGKIKDEIDHLYLGGEDGVELLDRLLNYYLFSKAKYLYIVISSFTFIDKVFKKYNDKLIYKILDKMTLNGEILYLCRITKKF